MNSEGSTILSHPDDLIIVKRRHLATALDAARIRQIELTKEPAGDDPYANLIPMEMLDEAIPAIQKCLANSCGIVSL
ncbi:MAG: hypothetical protein COA78_06805 [Blastopirellula sp.]|nr:MAG: hypothetical protein COA78_06805 [Blastopirellula sp.]